jgi:hypothetical protein
LPQVQAADLTMVAHFEQVVEKPAAPAARTSAGQSGVQD